MVWTPKVNKVYRNGLIGAKTSGRKAGFVRIWGVTVGMRSTVSGQSSRKRNTALSLCY